MKLGRRQFLSATAALAAVGTSSPLFALQTSLGAFLIATPSMPGKSKIPDSMTTRFSIALWNATGAAGYGLKGRHGMLWGATLYSAIFHAPYKCAGTKQLIRSAC